MDPVLETKWHSLEISEIFKILKSEEHGLSSEEANRRLREHGLNKLPEAKVDSAALIFLHQFQSPLIYILLGASLIVFIIGEATDSIVIAAVLILNAIVGSIQEGKARNTLLALKRFVETKAVILRDNKEIIVPDIQVVAGDIIFFQEGDKIAADSRIIVSRNLKMDESALTGESEAVHKTSGALANLNLQASEKKNMAFKGTNIVSGHGQAIVVNTGVETVVGKIASKVAGIDTEIPLKTNIRYLSRIIIAVTVSISVLIFTMGIISGKSIQDMLVAVISISVSVIPEGLPVAITIILATGVWRMGKRNALVKRLQAVEALGQARIIAVDKTGTITKNEMMVQKIYVDGKNFEIGGVGYEPKGEIKMDKQAVEPLNHPELLLTGKITAFCANARVMFLEKTKEWKIAGDPTEAAMLVLAEKLGFNKNNLEREFPLLSEIPFTYELKYHATLHKDNKKNFATVVGAPEIVLELCSKIWHAGKEKILTLREKESLGSTFSNISKKGLRILAFASSRHTLETLNREDIKNLTFVGFLGLKDALRPEVKETARRAMSAGIKVVMITGDHKITADAIAKEAGIYKDGDISLTGTEIDKFSDVELKKHLTATSVFARVTPEHKFRIINAYKARGEIIAMTGDGVNDAPSLVAADLGVAMGKVGTEVAKEASDIILLDDNFDSIISAIEEGRNIYKTIRKVILYLLSTSIGELLVIIGAIMAGFPLPLLPAQIIWLNFVTDGFFTVALAMEPREKGLLQSNFKKPKKYLIDAPMTRRMFIMAVPMMIGTLVLFQNYFEADIMKAWTISLTILAVFQWFNAWNCRSQSESIFKTNPFENKFMIGATASALLFQILAIYNPLFQKFLHTVPLDLSEWFVIISLATSIIFAEEIRKFFVRRKVPPAVTLRPALFTN
ncbi:MAG: HAD-IC family P-type ATPase [Candidatus Zambryskibacteria bacterium]|nr:HAD-IC family P-type ATPase [Candidatus Zambryskibacteria bacterium]